MCFCPVYCSFLIFMFLLLLFVINVLHLLFFSTKILSIRICTVALFGVLIQHCC